MDEKLTRKSQEALSAAVRRAAGDGHPQVSPAHLLAVEHELNHRPRMVLQDRCPADLFAALLTSDGPSVLRR